MVPELGDFIANAVDRILMVPLHDVDVVLERSQCRRGSRLCRRCRRWHGRRGCRGPGGRGACSRSSSVAADALAVDTGAVVTPTVGPAHEEPALGAGGAGGAGTEAL